MKITLKQLKSIIKEEVSLTEGSSWRRRVDLIGKAIEDVVVTTLKQEKMDNPEINALTDDQINFIAQSAAKLTRQEVKQYFVPQTHMDM